MLKLSLSIPRPPADAGLRDGKAWPNEMPDVPSAFRPTPLDGYRLAMPLPLNPVDRTGMLARTGVPPPPLRLRRRYWGCGDVPYDDVRRLAEADERDMGEVPRRLVRFRPPMPELYARDATDADEGRCDRRCDPRETAPPLLLPRRGFPRLTCPPPV